MPPRASVESTECKRNVKIRYICTQYVCGYNLAPSLTTKEVLSSTVWPGNKAGLWYEYEHVVIGSGLACI